jgi:hypothetical protein
MLRVFRITTASAAIFALFLSSAVPALAQRHEHPSHEHPRQCKAEPIEVTGSPMWGKSGAQSRAVDAWSQDVVSRFGTEYAEYAMAERQQPRCFHSAMRHGPLLFRHHDWQCTITAVPCRVPPGSM